MPAVIDVGSHTVRLLIGEWDKGALQVTAYQQCVTHLGEQSSPSLGLTAKAMARTLSVLERYSAVLERHGQTEVRVLGTQALRAAPNHYEFVERLRQRTGLLLEVIDGQQEAQLSATGVLSVLTPRPAQCTVLDVGGGSTELIYIENGQIHFSHSWPIGVVSLLQTEDSQQRIADGCAQIRQRLECCRQWSQIVHADCPLIGTAGTITTLAALQQQLEIYQPHKVTNYPLTIQQLHNLQVQLEPLSVAQREQLPGLEPGRGATLMPGLALLLRLMGQLEKECLVVCDAGLLQGAFCATWGEGPLLSCIN